VSTLSGFPAWAVVLIVTVSTTTFNANKLAALVDALGRAGVRTAVARRLARSERHTTTRDRAPQSVPNAAAAGLPSADLAHMVHDALAGTTITDRPDPAPLTAIGPPAPPHSSAQPRPDVVSSTPCLPGVATSDRDHDARSWPGRLMSAASMTSPSPCGPSTVPRRPARVSPRRTGKDGLCGAHPRGVRVSDAPR
jgi:hypothetical protein